MSDSSQVECWDKNCSNMMDRGRTECSECWHTSYSLQKMAGADLDLGVTLGKTVEELAECAAFWLGHTHATSCGPTSTPIKSESRTADADRET